MKSCPTCNRTFEDTFTFCLVDGTVLSAPFDPQATLILPGTRLTEPSPLEMPPITERSEEPAVTIASPIPGPAANVLPAATIASESMEPSSVPVRRSQVKFLIVIGAATLLSVAVILIVRLSDGRSANRSEASRTNANDMIPLNSPTPSESTPANSNLPPPEAIKLEGTAWKLRRLSSSYEATIEFKANGRFREQSQNEAFNGSWFQTGDTVVVNIPATKGYYRSRIEGKIIGNTISGSYDFFDGENTRQAFAAHLIK